MTKLREARKKAGRERAYVADALEISPDHLNLLERGKSSMSLKKIEVLAKIYNRPFEEMARIALETLKEANDIG